MWGSLTLPFSASVHCRLVPIGRQRCISGLPLWKPSRKRKKGRVAAYVIGGGILAALIAPSLALWSRNALPALIC